MWKWLMRTNARAVFGVAVAGLILVSAWWAWRILGPLDTFKALPSRSTGEQEEKPLGLLAFLDEQLGSDAPYVPGNPFLHPMRGTRKRHDRGTAAITLPGAPDLPKPPTPTPPKQPGPPKPPTPKERVTIVYRGVFKRPDGQMMALIQDSKNGSTRFYGKGETVAGLEVGKFDRETVEVIQGDRRAVSLPFGESSVFTDGEYDD